MSAAVSVSDAHNLNTELSGWLAWEEFNSLLILQSLLRRSLLWRWHSRLHQARKLQRSQRWYLELNFSIHLVGEACTRLQRQKQKRHEFEKSALPCAWTTPWWAVRSRRHETATTFFISCFFSNTSAEAVLDK